MADTNWEQRAALEKLEEIKVLLAEIPLDRQQAHFLALIAFSLCSIDRTLNEILMSGINIRQAMR